MSTATKILPSRLADIAGVAQVSNDPAELRGYAVDGKIPSAAVRPGSNEEVVEIVKFAAAEKLAVIVSGARTKLNMGLPPRQYDLALDMTRLDRVVACDPGDLTVAVEAGIPLKKLAGVLAGHKQFLPLAVPYFDRATVGGTIASGVDTPLRQFYGTGRDYLLGVEYVTGEGVLAKSGGRVVKNVTGYDLHKLMIGSLGTLGVVLRINFRTFTLPEKSRAFVALFESAGRALDMRHRMAQSSLTPSTLDVFSPSVADLLSSDVAGRYGTGALPANLLSNKHWALTTGYAGNDKVLARYTSELSRMAQEAGAVRVKELSPEEVPAAFSRKREFTPIAIESSPATTILKISVLPMRMKEMLEAAARIAESNSVPWAAMARGLGVIFIALLPDEKNEEWRRRVTQTADQTINACGSLEGNATIPWCPSEWKSTMKIWGLERADVAQMQKVKKVFDPASVLSPGRFMGGL
jgi:glycolate oxidase FAD binding subunit